MVSSKDFLLKWNQEFPLEYWWRKKYNVSFNSSKHREVSYIDIYYEWLEEKLYQKSLDDISKENERLKEYQTTGKWLSDFVDEEQERKLDEMFENMDISAFNDNIEDG